MNMYTVAKHPRIPRQLDRDSMGVDLYAEHRSWSPIATSTTQKTQGELDEELGFKIDSRKSRIEGSEYSRGQGNGKGRSLAQHFGEIKKVNAENQIKEIEELREEFGFQNLPSGVWS